jgi:hypothetical protein
VANLSHALLLTAPADLRAEPSQGALKDIVHRLHPAATWTRHPGTGGGKFALRSAARRWRHLAEEIAEDMTDGFVLSRSAPSGEAPSEYPDSGVHPTGTAPARPWSGEDADPAGADKQPHHDQHDTQTSCFRMIAKIPAITRMTATIHKTVASVTIALLTLSSIE